MTSSHGIDGGYAVLTNGVLTPKVRASVAYEQGEDKRNLFAITDTDNATEPL